MVMPGGLSGRDLAERLTHGKPDLRGIYMSGYSVELAEKGPLSDLGAGFLPKPSTSARLIIDQRRAPRPRRLANPSAEDAARGLAATSPGQSR